MSSLHELNAIIKDLNTVNNALEEMHCWKQQLIDTNNDTTIINGCITNMEQSKKELESRKTQLTIICGIQQFSKK